MRQKLLNIQKEYEDKATLYKELGEELVKQLGELLAQASIIPLVPIEFRVKSLDSIINKCERHGLRPKALCEIKDVAGLRIVLMFKKDLKQTCKIIEKNFDILAKEDKEIGLGYNTFGYNSIHYHLKPPFVWLGIPSLRKSKGLTVELQVRTICQHVWAAASHILQYKHEKDVPGIIRRDISRIAANLEGVDIAFESILEKRRKYLKKIEKSPKGYSLDIDSLTQFLDNLLPNKNKGEKEIYSELLEDLRFFKITTIVKLEEILRKHLNEIYKREASMVFGRRRDLEAGKPVFGTSIDRINKGVFYTFVGIVRMALLLQFGEQFKEYCVKRGRLP